MWESVGKTKKVSKMITEKLTQGNKRERQRGRKAGRERHMIIVTAAVGGQVMRMARVTGHVSLQSSSSRESSTFAVPVSARHMTPNMR